MIARFDHRPMLTAALALATIVLVVVVVTLSTLLITLQPAASPQSDSGGNPEAAAPANMDAGGESYGWNEKHAAECQAKRVSDSKFSDWEGYLH
jgi:hypothetical protein